LNKLVFINDVFHGIDYWRFNLVQYYKMGEFWDYKTFMLNWYNNFIYSLKLQ